MENHASVTGWQKLFALHKCFQHSAAVAIAAFEIYGSNFVFTESWSRDQVMQRAYFGHASEQVSERTAFYKFTRS